MDAFIVVIVENVLGALEFREQHTVLLPRVGREAAARAWFDAELPRITGTYPGRVRANFTVYYTQLTPLSWI